MANSTEEEQTCSYQDQEEFSSVAIPIFTGVTNTYQESQVDLSFSCSLPDWKVWIRQSILSLRKTGPICYRISELTDLRDNILEDESIFIVNKKSKISCSIQIYSHSLECLSKMNHIYKIT